MNSNDYIKKKKNNKIIIAFIAIVLATSLLGIGYASLSKDLRVNGTVIARAETELFISEVEYISDNNAIKNESKIINFYHTNLSSKVKLGNTLDSSITYEVTLFNPSEDSLEYTGTYYNNELYDNSDIIFSLDGINVGDSISPNEEKKFRITFKYRDDLATISNSVLNSYIKFNFASPTIRYKIIYDSSISTEGHSYPQTVEDGKDIIFYLEGTLPQKVYINGTEWIGYNQNTGRLVINDVHEDITLSAVYDSVGKAIFVTNNSGQLSNFIKNLSGNVTNIKSIKYASEIPDGVTTANVKSNDSEEDIYMWYDNNTLYWNSRNTNPILKGNYQQLFKGWSNLEDIEGVRTWDVTEVDNMREMFQGDTKLQNLEALRYWDTKNVTIFNGMFNGAKNLSSLDGLENFNLQNATDINSLFVGCSNLTDISAVKNWNVENVQSSSGVFQACTSLSNIDALSGWNLKNSKEMIQFFYQTQIEDLTPIANWDVSKVENMRHMFYQCKKITTLEPLMNWNTSSLKNLNNTFAQTLLLTNYNGLNNWDVSHVTDFSNTFDGNSMINNVDALANWDVSSGTTYAIMFFNNKSLTAESAAKLNGWKLNPNASFNSMVGNTNNKPTFMFDVNGTPTPGTWTANGTLTVPTA